MHYWGDKWFQENGERFYEAIDVFEKRIRKWARCGVYGKEKWGAYRDDFFRMWDGSWSQILFGYKAYYGNNWLEKLIYNIDNRLIPISKNEFGWRKVGLANLHRTIGLTKLVNKWQARQLNKAAQITCKEYPEFTDELLSDICFYKFIKPCKWGNVDGEEIHKKYWRVISPSEDK